jgi:rhizosphere induced protein
MTVPTYSLRLENASDRDWTFVVYQAPAVADSRIESLVWIASPSRVAPGSHALLMWHATSSFIWCTHSQHLTPMPFTASGEHAVERGGGQGVLFTQDNNGPRFESCTVDEAAGAWSIAVADNVPEHTYRVGTRMDGAGVLACTAMTSQHYDFSADYWIAAGTQISAASVIDSHHHSPQLAVRFPANVYTLSFYLDERHHWHPGTPYGLAAGHGTRTLSPSPTVRFPRSASSPTVPLFKE